MNVFFTEQLQDSSQGISRQEREKPPLNSITSKTAKFLKKMGSFVLPPNRIFPWAVSDRRICERVRNILGINANNPYLVHEKTVDDWLKMIKGILGYRNIVEVHLAGSAGVSGLNLPFFLCATEQAKCPNREELGMRLMKKKFPFADVDLKIKVGSEVNIFQFKSALDQQKDCVIEYFDDKVIVISITDEKNHKLDFVVYKELSSDFAFYSDDFSINITRSDLNNHVLIVNSINPWQWWRAQTLGLIENEGRLEHHLFPRLLGKLLKGEVCTNRLEDDLFRCWLQHLYKLKEIGKQDSLKFILDKQWRNHESDAVLSRYLLSLRVQQLMLLHNEGTSYLKEACKIDLNGDIPCFIKFLFRAMSKPGANISSIHAAIECTALVALCEGWKRPFQVKIVSHQGGSVLRIRFRGDFGKRDLLVKFDPKASLTALQKGDPEQIREIVRSLSMDGIAGRETTEDYRKELRDQGLSEDVAAELRKSLLGIVGKDKGKSEFVEQKSIASWEIAECDDDNQLLNIGRFVFQNYTHDPVLRFQLCWDVVDECLLKSAELIGDLRKAGAVPKDGYAKLFERVIDSGGDMDIYKACSPFPPIEDEKWAMLANEKVSKRRVLAQLIDEVHCSGDLFLDMINLSDVKKQSLSEEMLTKILQCGPQTAYRWLEKMDRQKFHSDAYKNIASKLICERPYALNTDWVVAYLSSGRFVGDEVGLCEYYISRQVDVLLKAKVLELLKIKESSLWHLVANECISRGEVLPDIFKTLADDDSKVIVACYEIIELADTSKALLEKLKKIENQLNDKLKVSVLVRLLKKWDVNHDDIPLLEFFDISKRKINWIQVKERAKTAKDLLKELKDGSLVIYTSLFRALAPKEECYHRWWVEKVLKYFEKKEVDQLVDYLKKPQVMECLRLAKLKSIPLLEAVAGSKRGIELTLDVLDSVSLEHLFKMIKSALSFDDGWVTATNVCSKYSLDSRCKRKQEYIQLLITLGQRLLMDPNGDIDMVCLISKCLGEIPQPLELPPQKNLIKLIRQGYPEYVDRMLNRLSPEQLRLMSSNVYFELLKATPGIEQKVTIFLNAYTVFSSDIQQEWENLLYDRRLTLDLAVKLLRKGDACLYSEEKTVKIAISIFQKSAKSPIVLDTFSQYFFADNLIRLANLSSSGHALWSALCKSKKIQREILWKGGCILLENNRNLFSEFFLDWMIKHCKEQDTEMLFKYVTEVLSNQERQSVIDWIKRLASSGYEPAVRLKHHGVDTAGRGLSFHKETRTLLNKFLVSSIYLYLIDNFGSGLPRKQKLMALMLSTLVSIILLQQLTGYTSKRLYYEFAGLELGYHIPLFLQWLSKKISKLTPKGSPLKVNRMVVGAFAGFAIDEGFTYLGVGPHSITRLIIGASIGSVKAGIETSHGESIPEHYKMALRISGIASAMIASFYFGYRVGPGFAFVLIALLTEHYVVKHDLRKKKPK